MFSTCENTMLYSHIEYIDITNKNKHAHLGTIYIWVYYYNYNMLFDKTKIKL